MGSWSALTTVTGITQGTKSAYIPLIPKETAHVLVDRTDAGSTDRMVVQVWGSVNDGTDESDTPLMQFEVLAANDNVDFLVHGVKSFAIGIDNAAGSPTDTITATIKYTLDRGLT